jgi:hypothetical protein
LILQLFNLPSDVLSKVQEGSDIGWMEDEKNSIFFTPFGNVQIIINETDNQIEINPIPGETQPGWENLINYIHEENKKIMDIIINKYYDMSSCSPSELKWEEMDGYKEGKWEYDF